MNKFRTFILYFLVFCIPFQLGKHFWPADAIILGFHLDLLSPVIYITDLFIALYLFINVSKLKTFFSKSKPLSLLVIPLLIVLSIIFSLSPVLALLSWSRWLFYFLLFIALTAEKDLLKKIRLPFLLSLLVTGFIAFSQLILQHSLGGLLYFLGERPLSPLLPQIAKFALPSGELFLRPYATFSHPNSLAGFLLVSLHILNKLKTGRLLNYIKLFVFLIILITFSKSALIALLVFLPLPFTPVLLISLLVSFLPLLSPLVSFPVWFGSSVIPRLNFGRSALHIINDHLFLGVGLNNYLVGLARYLPTNQISYTTLQPVHSLPLLFLAEFGIFGCLVLFYLLRKLTPLYQKLSLSKKDLLKKLILLIALTGSVDHYWWTLPQNKLILVLILAIIFNKYYDKHQIRHYYH